VFVSVALTDEECSDSGSGSGHWETVERPRGETRSSRVGPIRVGSASRIVSEESYAEADWLLDFLRVM
jgi:hypothetical protein